MITDRPALHVEMNCTKEYWRRGNNSVSLPTREQNARTYNSGVGHRTSSTISPKLSGLRIERGRYTMF